MISFKAYTFLSVGATIATIYNAIAKHDTFFNTVVYLTSQKLNLLIFFNFLIAIIINFGNLVVWIFFNQIRPIESKVTHLINIHST